MEITARPSTHINWEPAPKTLSRRCVEMLVYGDTDTRKTSFALTAPDPIFYAHSSENIAGKLERFSDKEILVFSFTRPQDLFETEIIVRECTALENEFKIRIDDAFKWARTIVIDTIDGFNDLQRHAEFGNFKAPPGKTSTFKYGPINSRFLNLNAKFKAAAEKLNQTNLIYIARTKDEWVHGEKGWAKSGRRVFDAQESAFYDSEVRVKMSRHDGNYRATIEKAFYDSTTIRSCLENDMATFAMIMDGQTGDITPWLE